MLNDTIYACIKNVLVVKNYSLVSKSDKNLGLSFPLIVLLSATTIGLIKVLVWNFP